MASLPDTQIAGIVIARRATLATRNVKHFADIAAEVVNPVIIHELGLGHPMKFIWEERAKALITYPNFWKQFYRKFPQYREASLTAREFAPGERVEVDYAGDQVEWYEIKTGEIHKAFVFVSGLGFSQLLFAWAAEDMKSRNWLGCHRRMFEYYGASVTSPFRTARAWFGGPWRPSKQANAASLFLGH